MTSKLEIQKTMKRTKKRIFSIGTLEMIGSIAILLVIWQVLVSLRIAGLASVPTPMEVFSTFITYIQSGNYVTDFTTSIGRIVAGFVLGVVTGIPFGLLLGWKRTLKDWSFPTFEILRPIPPLAWIPLAVIMFPSIDSSIVFIIWTGSFFPIVLSTMLGVNSIPENIKRSSLSLGVNERQLLRHVVIPATLPAILTGMALGMGICWNQLVAAEMLAGGSGLGYQLWNYYIASDFARVVMFMIIIGLIGYAFSMTIRFSGNRYLKWTTHASR